MKLSFKKTQYVHLKPDQPKPARKEPSVPDGAWVKCPSCGQLLHKDDIKNKNHICLHCHKHFRLDAKSRLSQILDEASFTPYFEDLVTKNVLDFPGYDDKIKGLQNKTQIDEAIVTGTGTIHGQPVAIGVMDSRFLMGSMGAVVGEKVARLADLARENHWPLLIFTASGGARMQEGIMSLMQMAKTSAAIKRLHKAGGFYLTVLTDPTTGGVTASFAMLGDIILAEPGALIGFAGPRVIRDTIKQELPSGFQRSEFLLEHGFIDKIVKRDELKDTIGKILTYHV